MTTSKLTRLSQAGKYAYRVGWLLIAVLCFCGDSPEAPALPYRSAPQVCFVGLGFNDEPPPLVSASGCFTDLLAHTLSPDAVPYGVNSALWTDGADKYRYMVVPLDTQIQVDAKGIWQFPPGALLIKEFGFVFDDSDPNSERVVETRFMQATSDDWRFFSYRWRDDGSDADLVTEAQTGDFVVHRAGEPKQIGYMFPDAEACTYCHSEASGKVLGPTTEQLNGRFDYGHRTAEQVEALSAAGYVNEQTLLALEPLPSVPDPLDEKAPLEQRAKSYLHANCAHCHQPGGWTSPDLHFDLRYTIPFAEMGLCNEPSRSLTAYAYPKLFVPGSPDESALLARMDPKYPSDRMPPIGVSVTDTTGIKLVREWISSVQTCP